MENTKQQTAVEWLLNELDNILELYPSEWEKVSKAVEQAKEMEKQQLQSEQIAKEHFRKQRDEGLLEQAKEIEDQRMIDFLKSVFQQDRFDYEKALQKFQKK